MRVNQRPDQIHDVKNSSSQAGAVELDIDFACSAEDMNRALCKANQSFQPNSNEASIEVQNLAKSLKEAYLRDRSKRHVDFKESLQNFLYDSEAFENLSPESMHDFLEAFCLKANTAIKVFGSCINNEDFSNYYIDDFNYSFFQSEEALIQGLRKKGLIKDTREFRKFLARELQVINTPHELLKDKKFNLATGAKFYNPISCLKASEQMLQQLSKVWNSKAAKKELEKLRYIVFSNEQEDLFAAKVKSKFAIGEFSILHPYGLISLKRMAKDFAEDQANFPERKFGQHLFATICHELSHDIFRNLYNETSLGLDTMENYNELIAWSMNLDINPIDFLLNLSYKRDYRLACEVLEEAVIEFINTEQDSDRQFLSLFYENREEALRQIIDNGSIDGLVKITKKHFKHSIDLALIDLENSIAT